MKRLISWLLALTLIFGLMPLSAFAAETDVEIGEGGSDIEVDFGDLVGPTYIELDTVVTQGPGSTFEVTVPAGESVYYKGGARYAGLVATIDGETEIPLTRADDGFVYLTITNETAEAKTYTVVVNYPLGSDMNPVVIEEMTWYSSEVSQAAGDRDGYFYTYTATETGVVTLYFNAVYDDNGDLVENVGVRDIMVTNMNTYAQYSLLQDGIDNYGLELQIPVEAGQQLMINTAWVKDAEGNYYPEATYSWTGNFAYPAGSEKNPISIEWAWDDAYANATANVTVEANGTYFTGKAGMILTANGTEIAQENGVFVLDAGTYELKLATPVGAMNNPEVIENIDGYTDSNSLEADANYYYIWTATEDGTVTLDVTDGANIVVDHITGTSEDGWPISVQSQLAEPEVDENWNYTGWTVAENLVIEVKAGEQLKIQVNGLTDWATWTTPAIDYTLTGAFESAAVPAPEYSVAVSGITLDMAAELFIAAKFLIPDELYADENATLTLEFKGDVTTYNLIELKNELGLDSKGRLVLKQPIPSPYMDKKITVTIADGNGYTANFTSGSVISEGSFSYGIEEYADVAFAQGANYNTTKDAIVALLTYGSYAQVYFKNLPNVSSEPAYNLLTKYGREPIDISAFSLDLIDQVGIDGGDSTMGITVRGGTPALDAAVYMTVQFNAVGLNIDEYDFTLKYTEAASGKNFVIDLDEVDEEGKSNVSWDSRGRFVIKIENISAALFDCMYSVEITHKTTGKTYIGQYSIFAYLKTIIAGYEGNASKVNDLNLYKAMYYYNQAANALFETK